MAEQRYFLIDTDPESGEEESGQYILVTIKDGNLVEATVLQKDDCTTYAAAVEEITKVAERWYQNPDMALLLETMGAGTFFLRRRKKEEKEEESVSPTSP